MFMYFSISSTQPHSVIMLFTVALLLVINLDVGVECYVRPGNVVQAQGLNATFLCQHPTDSGTIQWIINGTSFREASNDDMIRIEGRGNSTEALIMRALPQINGTEVVCVLYIIELNGTITVDRSTPATLTIQGTLEAVINLTSVSTSSDILLTWQPPFSLNLTTAEPDIVYCTDIFNITDRKADTDHLISNCSAFEPLYKFAIENPDPEDLFQFVVTPRSNVKGARNGTPSAINALYSLKYLVIPSKVVFTKTLSSCCHTSTLINVTITSIYKNGKPIPSNNPPQILLQVLPAAITFSLVVFTIAMILLLISVKLKKAISINKRGYQNEGIQEKEEISMNTCGAYNLVVPKKVVMEENPAYSRISHS